jgi:hypothetical protein
VPEEEATRGDVRLRSWKQIARYLDRDVRTVMRWEKKAGMPVHRVPGPMKGQSVYAFTAELDEWLGRNAPQAADFDIPRRSRAKVAGILLVGVVVIALSAVLATRPGVASEGPMSVSTTDDQVVARDTEGSIVWSWRHPEGSIFTPSAQLRKLGPTAEAGPGIFLAANVSGPLSTRPLRGELYSFTADGGLDWRVVPEDTLEIGGVEFSSPWVSGDLDIVEADGVTRLVWAMHHYTWWPAIVRTFDLDGEIVGTFVNAGWIDVAQVTPSPDGDRLLLGGVSNSRGGAMLAVLRADAASGRSPEEVGSEYWCARCPTDSPLRYLIFPPTHVNAASGLPYNRTASIHLTDGVIRVSTSEQTSASDAQWVYDFTRDFRLVSVTPGDSYWEQHRLLRMQGLIDHDEESCPERSRSSIRSWTPEGGWQVLEATR